MNNIEKNIKDSNTNTWGPSAWIFLHTITFNYPINPTENDKYIYKNFFNNLGLILPCGICQYNYNLHIQKYSIDNYLSTKDDLVNWLIIIHNEVNKLHNKPTKSFNEIIKYYTEMYKKNVNEKNEKGDYLFLLCIFSIIIFIILYVLYKNYIKYI